MHDPPALLVALETIRRAHGWTDAEMANHLDVTRPMYSMARKGSAHFSRRTLAHILRLFPGLEPDVLAYLMSIDDRPRGLADEPVDLLPAS